MSRLNLTKKKTEKTAANPVKPAKTAAPTGPKRNPHADSYTAFLAISLAAMIIGLALLFLEDGRLKKEIGPDPMSGIPKVSM